MGYNIAIGEAIFDGCKDDAYLTVWARSEAHDTAPQFENDPMTGNGNERSPGYAAWANFCRDAGLYGAFFGVDGSRNPYMKGDPNCYRETPLLANHPGYALLNEQDVIAFKAALEKHIAKHGDIVPGFRPWDEREEDAPPNATACAQRARLLWLCYWAEWAVANCEWPVLVNS